MCTQRARTHTHSHTFTNVIDLKLISLLFMRRAPTTDGEGQSVRKSFYGKAMGDIAVVVAAVAVTVAVPATVSATEKSASSHTHTHSLAYTTYVSANQHEHTKFFMAWLLWAFLLLLLLRLYWFFYDVIVYVAGILFTQIKTKISLSKKRAESEAEQWIFCCYFRFVRSHIFFSRLRTRSNLLMHWVGSGRTHARTL